MKVNINILICAISFSCLAPANAAEPTTHRRFVCEETVACGPSVMVDGNKVILNRDLIRQFAKKPTTDMLEKNLWEIIYFVNIFDKEAMSAAIDLLATIDPKQLRALKHSGIRDLARALTHQTQFWDVLGSKPLSIRRRVIMYFDINKADYSLGYDYEEWKQKMLRP